MILIAPFARSMRIDQRHPKNYPWWDKVLEHVDEHVMQVGTAHEIKLVDDFRPNLPLNELSTVVQSCKTWLSVDSFFQHFCWDQGKPGIVVFSQSDPNIFGHPENTNLLKSRNYLREKQFWLWEQCEYNEDAFVSPDEILNALAKFGVKLK